MSDFASVVERARRAAASVSKLEAELARDPESVVLQVNLAAFKKLAEKSHAQLLALSEECHIDVCNYRLIPITANDYAVYSVSRSLLEYQYLFSQVHDAKRNGPKTRARIGDEAWSESALDMGYSYSGSLGFVLFAHNERDFFDGKLDAAIASLVELTELNSRAAVRQAAQEFGTAVVKRVHDWSKVNFDGGFATDLLWKRSDGREIGRVVDRSDMERIVDLVEATSDENTKTIQVRGMLVGGDVASKTFHFVIPDGQDFRGQISSEYDAVTELTLGRTYDAKIRIKTTLVYATEKETSTNELISLSEVRP